MTEINLSHFYFTNPPAYYYACNNGTVVVTGQRIENDMDNGVVYYISQLQVTVTPDKVGQYVECAHDNVTNITTVGSFNITRPG